MIESVILFLIYLCLIVAAFWLILWVLGQLGVPIPAQVVKIGWVIVALVCILILYKLLLAPLIGGHLVLK